VVLLGPAEGPVRRGVQPRRRIVATGGPDGTVKLWDVGKDGKIQPNRE